MDRPKFVQGGGVYLLVYNGIRNRIIYVGTTINFENRWYEHSEGMRRGNRPVWRVKPTEDIYELISHKGFGNHFNYYHKLANDNLLWASTTLLKLKQCNDLNEDDHFNDNWYEYVCNHYMPNIHLWGCRMNERYEYATILESQIQRAFSNNFSIKSHINKSNMCWLGKIEHTNPELFKLKFEFTKHPDIDEKSLVLLNNLTEKNIVGYKKDNTNIKSKPSIKKLRLAKIKKIRKIYSQAYYPWDRLEDKIILFLLEENVSVDEMVHILNRSPDEIKRRIEKIKDLYK